MKIKPSVLVTVGGLDAAGHLRAYGWPGGYPIGYLTVDGDTLCAKCAEYWADDIDAAFTFEGSCIDYDGPQYCDGQTECDTGNGRGHQFIKCECANESDPSEWCGTYSRSGWETRDIHAGDFAPATTAEAIAVAGECDCGVRDRSDAAQLGVKRSEHYAGEIENDAFRCSWYRPAPVVDHSKLTHRR
jgi:hypothetical protein